MHHMVPIPEAMTEPAFVSSPGPNLDSKSRNEKKIAVNRWSKTRSPGLFAAILFYSADSDAMTTSFHPSGRRSPRSFIVMFHCSLC